MKNAETFEAEAKLLPCPFCGGEGVIGTNEIDFEEWPDVTCNDCGIWMDAIEGQGLPELVERWNTRKSTAAL